MSREKILGRLLSCSGNLAEIEKELHTFGWDASTEILNLRREHLIGVLEKYLCGQLSEPEVEHWGNLVEGREDIGIAPQDESDVSSILHEIANPNLAEPISKEMAQHWLRQLHDSIISSDQ